MDAQQVHNLIESQIGDGSSTTNHRGVDLRRALVTPKKILVIERSVRNGNVRDRLLDAWLVLIEKPETGTGFRIVLKDDEPTFGLASEGLANDEHLVVCGWHGDLLATFQGM